MSNVYPIKTAYSESTLYVVSGGFSSKDGVSDKFEIGSSAGGNLVDLKMLSKTLKQADKQSKFVKLISQALAQLGISHFSMTYMDKAGDANIRFTRFPCGLNRKLARLELNRYGMVMDYINAGNTVPIFLSSIAKFIQGTPFVTRTIQRSESAINLCERFGFNDLYFMTTTNPRGGKWIFTFGALDIEKPEFRGTVLKHQQTLKQIVDVVARIVATKTEIAQPANANRKSGFDPDSGRFPALEQEAITLLQLLATTGVSMSVAADTMGISRTKAGQTMAVIKLALNASSLAQVIFNALKLGLISFDKSNAESQTF